MIDYSWEAWKIKKENYKHYKNNNMNSTSPKYSLDKTDLYKLGRLFLVMMAGTVITYVSSIYMNINFVIPVGGSMLNLTPLLIPIISLGIDTARKFLNNYAEANSIDIPA